MVDIGTSDKITNLWPAPASRPIHKSGQKDKSFEDQQQQQKKKKDKDEDGPGTNIDEYA